MTDIIDVVVIGGGFSGLFTATQLARTDRDVVLLEASSRPGGVATTIIEDGFVLEPGAGTFMLPHRALTPILDAAGVALEETYPAAARSFCSARTPSQRFFPPMSARSAAIGAVP